ncbi:hypothetical protein [Amycolatopsis sp. CA-128772]|uniref:hypothetical protein n=1 Tax=Amycolatopsis sp. CA-128772 TaxID=2073159 RepID=UPI000CD28F5B|nr:hypothetical protein [Amycolatopsis sp. CA-128772]
MTEFHNTNHAADEAHVEQQIGAIYGGTFHRNETTYNINPSDPPERRFEVALERLKGGMPRPAESLLRELVEQGHDSTELAYYYALSILSDRSLNEVTDDIHQRFRTADLMAKRFANDAWRGAMDVVWQLMSCVWQQEMGVPPDAAELEKATANLHGLHPERQAEITRHLSLVLGGALQDILDAQDAERVRQDRLANDRVGRAWKFFEPDPAPPRFFVPARAAIPSDEWVKAAFAGVGVLMGIFALLNGFSTGRPEFGVPALLVMVAGFGIAIWAGREQELGTMRLAARDREHGIPLQYQQAVSPGHWVRTDFVQQIHKLVELRFWAARPNPQGNWVNDTRGICEYYKWRFVALFGNAQVQAGAVNWLIRWHAKRVAAEWRNGTLYAYRDEVRPSPSVLLIHRTGLAIAATGALIMLAGYGGFAGAGLFLGIGGYFAVKQGLRILVAQQFQAEETERGQRLLREEEQAYASWLRVLADRPDDAEMARWLDLDKAYLKTEALRRCALTNRDLVAHVTLTEGAANARRARVLGGPMRYSRYVILVFLLTRSGVREIEVDLDFLKANVHDERRTSFRYDALAAARVAEVGVRYADGWHYEIVNGESASLRKRAFRLTLVSGEKISVVAEGFEGLADENLENEAMLQRMAMESSGIAGALHVLEAVSAEGRDWIAREQERRRRRSEDWSRRNDGPGLLGGFESPADRTGATPIT